MSKASKPLKVGMPLLFAKMFSVPYHTTPQTERLLRYNHLHLPKNLKTSEKKTESMERCVIHIAGTFCDPYMG